MASETTPSRVVCFVVCLACLMQAAAPESTEPKHRHANLGSVPSYQQYCLATDDLDLVNNVKDALKKLDSVLSPPNMSKSPKKYCLAPDHLDLIGDLKRTLEELDSVFRPPPPKEPETPQEHCFASDHLNLVGNVKQAFEKLDNLVLRPPFPNLPGTLTNVVEYMNVEGLKNLELDEDISKTCTKNGPSVHFSASSSRPIEFTLIRKDLKEASVVLRSPWVQVEGSITQKKKCDSTCVVDECFTVGAKVLDMGTVTVEMPKAGPMFQKYMPAVNAMLDGKLDFAWKVSVEGILIDAIRKGLTV